MEKIVIYKGRLNDIIKEMKEALESDKETS